MDGAHPPGSVASLKEIDRTHSASVAPCADPITHAMSVDVEDYFQVWAFNDVVSRKSWDGFALRVEENTHKILDIFDEADVKATFFTLGWIAERTPGVVREIAARGHEVASHGHDHTKVFLQTKEEFYDDVSRSKSILEDLTGQPVQGYRAPGFSINGSTPFAYDVLTQLGFRYSSSAHPIAHDHYGDPNGERAPHAPISGGGLIEAPVATAPVFGRRISAAGGGWFRAFPYDLSKSLIDRARETSSGPVIFYFHPWEIDPAQPRIKAASLKARFRHYLNLSHTERKLKRLLGEYTWGRIDDALGLQPMAAAA